MKKYIFILINCCLLQIGFSQNLVPDEDMNLHFNNGCPSPIAALLNAQYWYNVDGTCDFYIAECLASANQPIAVRQYPSEGNNFIGFWGVFRDNWTMGSEAFGTSLVEPLVQDDVYFFSVDVRYRGKWNGYDDIYPQYYPHYCYTDPPMALKVYFNNDTIRPVQPSGIGSPVGMETQPILSFDKSPFQDTSITLTWTTLADCFIAKGGETHLGFSMTIDSFTAEAPCDSTYRTIDGQISRIYYNLDKVKVIQMPKTITDTFLLCKESGEIAIDIKRYFPQMDIEQLDLEWSDGVLGTVRTFQIGGQYNLRLYYKCGYIDFDFLINEKRCEATAFVPDAFTPNFDGRNDDLFPFFSADFPITNYEFMVFDRWGTIFYRSTINDGSTGWDGTVNGKSAQNGVYVWALKFDLIAPDETKSYQLSGDVLLVR